MLSMQSLDILFDLTEIKLNTLVVQDKDDLREFKKLKECKRELLETISECMGQKKANEEKKSPQKVSTNGTCKKKVNKINDQKHKKEFLKGDVKKQNIAI